MKDKFQSKAVPRGTRTIWRYLSALILLLTFAIGNVWADEIFSWTATSQIAKNASEAATGGSVTCTGSGFGSESPSGSGFYKFNSSTQLTCTLSSGTFAAGDEITFTFTSAGSNKTVGVEIQETSPVTQLTEKIATAGTSVSKTYTVTASDGIDGQNKFSIKRVDSNFSLGAVSVSRASSGGGEDPVCPSGLTISSKDNKTSFLEGDKIELTAALSAGNGTISYQWYKGSAASGNEISGANKAKLEIASCVEGDAGSYYCVASKAECTDAVSSAFAITVAHNPCTTHHWFVATADATANSVTNWNGFTNAVTGSSGQTNSVTIDGTTYNLTKRTGSTGGGGTILGFTIPANKAGTLYGYMKSSGSAARILSLKKGDDVIKTNTEIVDGAWTLITIDAIAPGTYTLSPDQNVQVQMFVLKICDATFRTITLDLNGGTGETSISALDGAPATKPADPTRDHFRFDGWFDVTGPYDWSAPVTGDLTLTAHWTQLYTVTFAAGEGSGDAPAAVADKAQGETFEVPANTFTAPANNEFDKWNDGTNDYAPGATYTVGTANVVLTAQWKAAVAKYSVIFKDGETELGTKLFDIGSNPSDADIDKTKPLFAFAAWQKEGSDIALDDASWASLAANAEVTLTARWEKLYASSVDLEGLVEAEGTGADWQAYMTSHGFAFSTSNVSLDAKNPDKTYANWPYQGLKAKAVGAFVEGNINAGKLVIIKLGHMAAAADVLIGGEPAGTATGLDAAEPEGQLNYFYVENEALLHYETTNAGACVLKAITIQDPFEVSFDENGGDAQIAAMYGTPSITLPNATKGTDNFAGWYDALDNFIGNAGASYTPSADIQLVAHWETLSTDNTLSDLQVNDVTVEGFSSDVHTYYIVLPYGTDVSNLPKITLATPNNANASVAIWPVDGPAWTDDFGGCYRQQVNVTPQDPDAAVGYNDIRITVAPKDGVSIIKVATTGGTNKTVTGLYAGEGDVNLSSSTKMDNGKFIGFTLDGTTLQAGDQINVHTTQAANTGGSHIIFYDNMTDKNELYETGKIGGEGDNIFTINAAMEGHVSAYVYRSNADAAHQWNGYVDFIEVTRPMNPVLTAISIDDRPGELDMSAANHFNVLIPYESDLAALTIVPEIVWNAPAADNSIVVNDGGAWKEGDNTYKLTDKDGDFTVYTITLTRDVLKHTVSFNTHGGPAIDPVLVVDGHSLTADQVPADPEKEDYLFQGWAEAEDGASVDVTSFAISADKTFHAVWAPDGAIKLIVDGENPGEKVINHTNFITGAAMASSKVTVEEVEYNYAQLGGTASTPSGQNQLTKFIAYNATTTQTKVMVNVYNNSTNARSVVIKGVVEGSTEVVDLATINLDNGDNKHVKSAYYEFNNAANRTIYISVPNTVASIDFLQVKVIESGEPLKMFGENGYSINLNKGRLFGLSATDLEFEGMTYNLGSNYSALSSTAAVFKKNTSYQIDVPAAVTMTLTTSASKFYVSQAADGTDNETAADGAHDFDLTAGTWFINVAGSNLNVTNIAFSAPKCEKPEFTALANSELCEGDAFAELNGTANVSDGGTVSYQWYNEDDSAIEGAINAKFTPSADGKYYVIATNSLADHADNFNKSDLVTVAHLAGTIITSAPADVRKDAGAAATLTVVAEGKNLAYEWFTCDEDGGNAVAVDPAATEASLEVSVPSGVQYYKVVVTGECGEPVEAIVKVEEWVELEQVSVSESTVWDWATIGNAINATVAPEKNVEILMANIRDGEKTIVNDASFNSQALLFYGQEALIKDGSRWFAKGGYISFNTTVPGVVTVEFSDNGNNNRRLSINGKLSEPSSAKGDVKSFMAIVPAGEVKLMGVNNDGSGSNQYIRISKITFSTVDYTREVNSGRYGTICLPNSGKMYGASLFEIAYYDANAKKIFFDEILDGEMVAGMPYIFLPNSGVDLLAVSYTDEANADASSHNGLVGFIGEGENDALDVPVGAYILNNNQYRLVQELGSAKIRGYRSYIQLEDISTTASAPAPGRRRISMGVQGAQVATGIEDVQSDNVQCTKVLIDGQLFILRGEKMFDAKGQLVK